MIFPDFEVDDLFQDISGPYADKRQKVEERLVELAEREELCVTMLLNQSGTVYDMIGEVILGRAWDMDGNMYGTKGYHTNVPIPEELEEHMVKVASVDGKSEITFETGTKIKSTRTAGGTSRKKIGQPQFEVRTKTHKASATMPLKDAYLALKFGGAWCVPAESPADRARKWKYIEINNAIPYKDVMPAKKTKAKKDAAVSTTATTAAASAEA